MKFQLVWLIILISISFSCNKDVNKPLVTVYGHAGMSIYDERTIYPPNSFESIQHAVEIIRVEGVEIDIQMTKDSVLVLYHDTFISNSPGFNGCIGNYDWSVIKDMPINFSKYKVCDLKSVLDYTVSKNIKVYLDIKEFNFCEGKVFDFDLIASGIDSIILDYSDYQKGLIMIGAFSVDLLNRVNLINKCLEGTKITKTIRDAQLNGFNNILFKNNIINKDSICVIDTSGLNWGVFGGKANGEIRKSISFSPDFMISDNAAYTLKITE